MKSPRRNFHALVLALMAAATVACGSTSPISPSSLVGGSSASTRLNAGEALPAPLPDQDGISCPSDAPAFKAEANPGHLIKLEWQKMPKADYIRIYVWRERFGQWEIVEGSPKVVGEHGQWYDGFHVSDDGVYLVKLATVTCGAQRNMSDAIVVTFGDYVPPTTIPAPPILPTPPSDDPPSDGPPNDGPPNDGPPNDGPGDDNPPSESCSIKYQGVGTVTGSPNGIAADNSNGTVKLNAQLRNGTFGMSIEYFKDGAWHVLTGAVFTVGCAPNTFPKSVSGNKVSGATGYRFTITEMSGAQPAISGTQFGNGSVSLE